MKRGSLPFHWRLRARPTKIIHGLVILSLLITNLSAGYPAYAAAAHQQEAKNKTEPLEKTYVAPTFEHPEPRVRAERDQSHSTGSELNPATNQALDAFPSASSRQELEVDAPPPDEPFEVLESHAEFAHPWIQVTEFSTDCPLGMVPDQRYGLCEATFTFYNGSNFTISEYGGYDLRVGYVNSYWQGNQPTYYTSVTEICRVGIFNRVESCIHQPVIQDEVFKAQDDRFPIAPLESITMTKTIFWSLDPDVWWIDPRSSDASCTNKNSATDARECPWCNPSKAQGYASDPINSLTGTFDYQVRDLSLNTLSGALSFSRCYASNDPQNQGMGYGWVHNHASSLTFPSDPGGQEGVVWFRAHCANQYAFLINDNGTYSPAPGVPGSLVENTGPPVTYTVTNELGAQYTLDDQGKLLEWADAYGRTWSYSYDASARLERVTDDDSGRYLAFSYDGSDRLIGVADHTARGISLGYDASNNLITATDVMGATWNYSYDADHHLTEVVDPRGITEVRNEYDEEGRAFRQFNGEDERIVELTFHEGGITEVADALGNVQTHTYDETGALVEITDAHGNVIHQTFGENHKQTGIEDPLGHLTQMVWGSQGVDLLQVVDAAGSITDFSYDSSHNLTEIVDVRGYLTSFGYADRLLTSVTDALGGVSTYSYTPEGLVETVTDALGRITTFAYDGMGQPTAMTDALGNTWMYGYDSRGRLEDVTDPLGRVTHTVYDEHDRIIELIANYDPSMAQNEEDQWNIRTAYRYDAVGNLRTITDTLGRVNTFSYDNANRIIELQDSSGNTTQFAYDVAGNLIHITDALSRTTSLAYDAKNRLQSTTDALGNTSLQSYYADDNLALFTDPLGRTVSFTYNALGQLIASTDPLGNTTTYTYDVARNLTGFTDANGHTAHFGYDALNRLTLVTDALGHVTEHFYDAVGNRVQTMDARGNATTYSYDDLNHLTSVTDPLGHVTSYSYDAVGNLVSATDPLGNVTTFSYDGLDRRILSTNPLGHQDSFGYDAVGNLVSWINANGIETQYEYDDLARLLVVVENYQAGMPHDAQTNVHTEYTYDAVGNLLTQTDPLNSTSSFSYDPLNRLLSVTDPLGNITTYAYDAVGNWISTTDALGFETQYNHDAANRLVGIDYPAPDSDIAFDYDPVGKPISMQDDFGTTLWTYDALNRITQVEDPFGTEIDYSYDAVGNRTGLSYAGKSVSYSYDAANRLVRVVDWDSKTTTYGYDAAHRLQTVSLPNHITSSYGYDAAGHLTSLTHSLPGTTLAPTTASSSLAQYTYTYDPVGNLIQTIETLTPARTYTFLPLMSKNFAHPSVPEENTSEGFTPSTSATPTMTATPSALPIATWTPTLTSTLPPTETSLPATSTPASTSTSTPAPIESATPIEGSDQAAASRGGGLAAPAGIAHLLPPSAALNSQTLDYSYDPLGRLTSANNTNGDFYNYTYDAAGNRLELESASGTTTTIYDAAHRIASVDGIPFTWDANGRLLEDSLWSYSYDHAGRLVEASNPAATYAYGYNGLGDRIWLENNGIGNALTLDLNRGLTQVLSDGSSDYLFGMRRIGEAQQSGWLYGLPDALGTQRQATGQGGRVSISRNYSPFGVLTDELAFRDSVIGFAGEWTDPTGLLNLRARYYAPDQGRFTSPDPFGGIAILPATLHPYLYALNNPLLYTDPSGEFPMLLAALLLAGSVGALFEWGSQVYNNMANCGMSFWDAAYYKNLDAGRLGLAFVEGAVLGTLGYLTGGLIAWAGLEGFAAFALGAVVDIGAGMVWDIAVRGYSPSEALFSNLISFGIGEAIGYGAKKILRFATAPNTAFFWSGRTDGFGGEEIARSIAESRGGVTLEILIEERGIEMPEWGPPGAVEAWKKASREYAQAAIGEVWAVLGEDLRPGNIWETVELVALLKNPKVTKITAIDPKTLIETVLFGGR